MEKIKNPKTLSAFQKDVSEGLTRFPKQLSSRFIYDRFGDRLFQQIMAMPEYYLTDCEYEIISKNTTTIGELFRNRENGLDLIELGAGDGKKTKVLLKYMASNKFNFVYKPIDISENALQQLTANLAEEIPSLSVDPEEGEYFEVLERLKGYNKRKKVIMVLGSNIGNLSHPQAVDFLSKLQDTLLSEDLLFMGFDQKKDPQIILDAYNDKTGITAAFNKNLLHRINRDLGGNFDVDKFKHWEIYNPETGTAESFLIAQEPMNVFIEDLGLEVVFQKWETIHVEISQKYDDATVEWLALQSNLEIVTSYSDEREYYKNYIFKKK